MAQRPYKVRKKISATMQGTSNFAGKEHTIGSKAKISDRRGSYNPIGTKKWFVHGDTAKTLRKTQNPGGLFRRGRTVKENQMKSFIEYVVEDHAMVKKMSDEHPEARFRTNPLKPTMSMKDRMAQKKNLSNLLKKRMNEGKLKDMVTGHMDKGKSYDQAMKAAQKDLDRMKPKQPSQQMKLPMKSEANHLANISTTHKNMDGSPIGASVARALEKGRKQQGSRAGKTYAQMSRGEKAADTKRHYAMLDKMRKGTGPLKTEMRGPQRGSTERILTPAQKRKEQEFNKRAGIIEPEEAPSSFQGSTKPKPYHRATGNR